MPITCATHKERVHLRLSLVALGTDAEGRQFSEPARTVEIQRDGALLMLPATAGALHMGQTITLRHEKSAGAWREGRGVVVHQLPAAPGWLLYDVRLVDSAEGFWPVAFPASADYAHAVACILLECCFCRRREVVYVNEREMLSFNAQKGIARICAACSLPTIWIQTLDEDSERLPARCADPAHPGPVTMQQIGMPTQAHHKQVAPRFRTRLTACVRAPGSEEELAVCENMSRGGLCFRARRAYPEESTVEVAVPFTKGAANIFVPARVVYVQEVPAARLYRHGATYVHGTAEEETEEYK